MPLAATMASTVEPYRRAMMKSVSPRRTTWTGPVGAATAGAGAAGAPVPSGITSTVPVTTRLTLVMPFAWAMASTVVP
ncbi:MAG: hypothetical protein ACRD0A_13090 [Acidimicrobiales bacterium]